MKFVAEIFLCLCMLQFHCNAFPNLKVEDPAVTRFRDYLRIPTNFPDPDYESGIAWVRQQSEEIGLEFNQLNFESPAEFAIWLTWPGSDPTLKSILMNSHMDVVAVDESKWDHPPFEAYKDEAGIIYGRGTCDVKSSTVATLEAIRRLKENGYVPLRTIHISVIPDEEKGGINGMKPFVESEEFASLNVGFDIDETGVNEGHEMLIEYGQKSVWQFNFTTRGISEHGSNMPEVTAAHRIQIVIDRLMEYRGTQYELMMEPGNDVSDVTSLNLVQMSGGIGDNIIPDELWASFDMRIRITPEWTFTDVEEFLDSIVEEAGPEVSYTFITKSMETGETIPDDSNVWWRALQNGCNQLNITCVPDFIRGATDGKYVRTLGIPVFGVNAFINSRMMAHMDNEQIHEQEFLNGIDRYVTLITTVTSVSKEEHP